MKIFKTWDFSPKGNSYIELVIITGIIALLIGLGTINLNGVQQRTSLSTVIDTFISNLKLQQIKAMQGDTGGGGSIDYYSIHIENNSYTLYKGSNYSVSDPSNFVVGIPSSFVVTTHFSDNKIVFLKGSGQIASYNPASSTITFKDTGTNIERTITMNRYGVITGIN